MTQILANDRRSLKAAGLDARIREAERATYDHYGLSAVERLITVDTSFGPTGVRLMTFGPSDGDDTPILLLHGIASLTVLAAPLLTYLTDRRVIAVDWPGHGLSGTSKVPHGTVLRNHAATTIRGVLDELRLDEVDIVGHSLGGQFGLYAALGLGNRVRRLVLLGAPGAGLEGVKPVTAMKLLAIPGLGRLALSIPMSDKALIKNNEAMLGAGALSGVPESLLLTAKLASRRRSNWRSIASYFRSLLKRGKVRAGVAVPPTELAQLAQPTLFAWGAADVFLSPDAAKPSIEVIPDHRLVRVPGAGHAPWLQAEKAIGEAVAQHLR